MAFLDTLKKLPEEATLALGRLAALTHTPKVLIAECDSLEIELQAAIADVQKVKTVLLEIQAFDETLAPAAVTVTTTAAVATSETTTTTEPPIVDPTQAQ